MGALGKTPWLSQKPGAAETHKNTEVQEVRAWVDAE